MKRMYFWKKNNNSCSVWMLFFAFCFLFSVVSFIFRLQIMDDGRIAITTRIKHKKQNSVNKKITERKTEEKQEIFSCQTRLTTREFQQTKNNAKSFCFADKQTKQKNLNFFTGPCIFLLLIMSFVLFDSIRNVNFRFVWFRLIWSYDDVWIEKTKTKLKFERKEVPKIMTC